VNKHRIITIKQTLKQIYINANLEENKVINTIREESKVINTKREENKDINTLARIEINISKDHLYNNMVWSR